MAREELETEVSRLRELEQRVQELERRQPNKAQESSLNFAFATLAQSLVDEEVSNTQNAPDSATMVAEEFEQLRERLAHLEEFESSFGERDARNRDEAWFQAVRAASNLENNPQNNIKNTSEVALYIDNLEQATGYTDRHCSNLIEEWGEEKDGARWVAHREASEANKGNATRKHIAIDLDVWGNRL